MLKGYMTKIGAIGVVLTGLGILINCLVSGNYDNLQKGIETVSAGIIGLGIARKLEVIEKK